MSWPTPHFVYTEVVGLEEGSEGHDDHGARSRGAGLSMLPESTNDPETDLSYNPFQFEEAMNEQEDIFWESIMD